MGHPLGRSLAVTLSQPAQVKEFGMPHLRRAKTDRIDAVLIAACTRVPGEQNKVAPDSRFEALGRTTRDAGDTLFRTHGQHQPRQPLTGPAQSRSAVDVMRLGCAIELFQASQRASTMAS